MNTEEERKVEFLIELAKLSRKTGIVIGGCGCCGSPYLTELQPDELDKRAGYGYGYKRQVSWISPSDSYVWDNYAGTIVRETTA